MFSLLGLQGAVFSHSEGAEEEPMKAEDEMNSIIEELQSWKVDHDKWEFLIFKVVSWNEQ